MASIEAENGVAKLPMAQAREKLILGLLRASLQVVGAAEVALAEDLLSVEVVEEAWAALA